MKRRAFFLAGLVILFCGACQKENTPLLIEEGRSTYEDSVDSKDKDKKGDEEKDVLPDCINNYDEPADSMEGVEDSLTELIAAGSKIKDRYVTKHEQFLTEECMDYYKINYGKEIQNNYSYTQEKVGSFTLMDLTSDYITSGEFHRVAPLKYESTKSEVVNDFIQVVHPGLENAGYFLTFNKVTIELNNINEIHRVRLYVKETQIGKLIPSHKSTENANWYLLFAQCYLMNEVK